jgi:RNA ligase (TIGR02306 family)
MRKLATIQKILEINPIPEADAIEVATIKGWKVVVKKGEFKVGDLVVYFEIDSLIPNTSVTNFLMKREEDKEARLKTIRLRGQISQGLILSLEQTYTMIKELGEIKNFEIIEGTDLSDILHIEKYEPPIRYGDEGKTTLWPFLLSKTDEERIQNIPEIIEKLKGKSLCASVKLDGTSMTVIAQKEDTYVAGRNYAFNKEDDTAYHNKYWETAKKYNLIETLDNYRLEGRYYAVQGELVGPGIQGNKMNLSELNLYIFNLFISKDNCKTWEKLGYNDLINFCNKHNLKHVPYVLTDFKIDDYDSVEKLLELAKGTYRDNANDYFPNARINQMREGLVIRTLDHLISFKVINNEFLLKGGD